MAGRDRQSATAADWLADRVLRLLIGTLLALPYERRVRLGGWMMRNVLAPIAGYNRRSMANLAHVFPRMPEAERRRIARQVADNMGRTFIENYSAREFLARHRDAPILGPGLRALEEARGKGRPVILVTGHFGNYEAPRAALVGRGFEVGGLYRPARNRFFDKHYKRTMMAYGGPIFAQGRRGTTGFVRHLRAGGQLVLLFDQHVARGAVLPFLGQPARTALSAAELALRYDALLIPFYGTRNPDGLSFTIEMEAPVPHSDPETMTRALNASLEARVRRHPGQWLWVHRRWKVGGRKPQRKRAAPSTGPGPAS